MLWKVQVSPDSFFLGKKKESLQNCHLKVIFYLHSVCHFSVHTHSGQSNCIKCEEMKLINNSSLKFTGPIILIQGKKQSLDLSDVWILMEKIRGVLTFLSLNKNFGLKRSKLFSNRSKLRR